MPTVFPHYCRMMKTDSISWADVEVIILTNARREWFRFFRVIPLEQAVFLDIKEALKFNHKYRSRLSE